MFLYLSSINVLQQSAGKMWGLRCIKRSARCVCGSESMRVYSHAKSHPGSFGDEPFYGFVGEGVAEVTKPQSAERFSRE